MDSLAGYDSSPERVPGCPPPPPALDMAPRRKGRRDGEFALPAVVPVSLREDRFLVHVRLPVVHERLQAFVRARLAQARLRLVGGPVKAAFVELADLHVSVARPATVRSAQIGKLVGDLKEAISRCERVVLEIRGRVVGFASGNSRRVFVAAPLAEKSGQAVAVGLIKAVDLVFAVHGLPVFFDNPKPHMSFAWTETVDVLPKFSERDCAQGDVSAEDVLEVPIDTVVCSIGKSNYYFTLR